MQNLEQEILSCGDIDYKKEQKKASFFYKHPQLKEIAKKMGREKEKSDETDDSTMTKYIPILLKHSHDKQDIDGVSLGNNLDSLLPMEIAMLDSPTFYAKFAKDSCSNFLLRPHRPSRKNQRFITRSLASTRTNDYLHRYKWIHERKTVGNRKVSDAATCGYS